MEDCKPFRFKRRILGDNGHMLEGIRKGETQLSHLRMVIILCWNVRGQQAGGKTSPQ